MAILLLAETAARPNLLVIRVDGISPSDLEHLESGPTRSNFGQLAADGLTFTRAFATSATPEGSSDALLTAQFPVPGTSKRESPSLIQALQKGGYDTILLGSGLASGNDLTKPTHLRFQPPESGDPLIPDTYAKALGLAIKRATSKKKPFFVIANLSNPGTAELKRGRRAENTTPEIDADRVDVPAYLPDLPEIRAEIADHLEFIHHADQVTGALVGQLERDGLNEQTLVLLTGTHGVDLPFVAGNCYPASNRIPWILRWPGSVEAGTRDTTHFVSDLDIAPTLLEAAGLPALPAATGHSVLPLLEGESQPGRSRIFTTVNDTRGKGNSPTRALNDGEFLYIWNGWSGREQIAGEKQQNSRSFKAMREAAVNDPAIDARLKFLIRRCPEEMYDLTEDPDCLNNLISRPNDRWTPRSSAMSKALWHHMKRLGDPSIKQFQSQVELALD